MPEGWLRAAAISRGGQAYDVRDRDRPPGEGGMSRSTRLGALALLAATALPIAATAQTAPAAATFRDRLPQDEVIYFLLPDRFDNGDPSNDRGGLTGDRLHTGYDPTAKGFYH